MRARSNGPPWRLSFALLRRAASGQWKRPHGSRRARSLSSSSSSRLTRRPWRRLVASASASGRRNRKRKSSLLHEMRVMLPLRRRLALPMARRKLRQRRLDVPTADLHVACSPRQGHTPSRTRTRPQSLRMVMRLHVLTELLGRRWCEWMELPRVRTRGRAAAPRAARDATLRGGGPSAQPHTSSSSSFDSGGARCCGVLTWISRRTRWASSRLASPSTRWRTRGRPRCRLVHAPPAPHRSAGGVTAHPRAARGPARAAHHLGPLVHMIHMNHRRSVWMGCVSRAGDVRATAAGTTSG